MFAVAHLHTCKHMRTLEIAQGAESLWPGVTMTLPVRWRLGNFHRFRAINLQSTPSPVLLAYLQRWFVRSCGACSADLCTPECMEASDGGDVLHAPWP